MSQTEIWQAIALGVIVLTVLLLGLLVRRRIRRWQEIPPDERAELRQLPMTPMARRALWGLLIGVAMLASMLALFLLHGDIANYFDDSSLRLPVTAVFIGGLVAYLALMIRTYRQEKRDEVVCDERDLRVMRSGPVFQSALILCSLVAWAICLTEAYRDEGGIPIVFPYLIVMSSFIFSMIGHSGGVLLAYWWMMTHAEG